MWPVLFKIGNFTIYTYGLFVFIGVIVAYSLAVRTAGREGLDKDKIANLIFWSLVSGFVGARLLYIVLDWGYFLKYPGRLLLERSGFVFYGGLFGAGVVFWYLVRKYSFDFFKVADIISLYLPLGHAFGRIGCFCYGCCYGHSTDAWFGIHFHPDSPAGLLGQKLIPVQLISAAVLLVIFFVLRSIRKKQKFTGQIFVSYICMYGLMRFAIEFLRADPRGYFLLFSTSQWVSIIFVTAGIMLWRKLPK